MLKALNKYKKWILVVGGSLLMVAFLLPEAIRNIRGDPMKEVLGTVAGESIRRKDLLLAEREVQALNQLVPEILANLGPVEGGLHWLLLTREAERAGLVAGPREGEEFITGELAEQLLLRTVQRNPELLRSPEDVDLLRDRARGTMSELAARAAGHVQMTPDEMHRALARLRGVLRLVGSYAQAARLSDKRTLLRAVELGEQAVADYFTVRARDLAHAEPEPSTDDLAAHFARFRDVPRGGGEFGIGYTLPPRVKIQYLTLEMRDARDAVRIDPVEVRKRYLARRADYPGEFEVERPRIEAALREATAQQIMNDAVKIVQAEVRKRIQRLEIVDQYRVLPQDWEQTRPRLDEIAQFVVEGVKGAHGVDLPLPTVTTLAADWLTAEDLRALPHLASSIYRHGQSQISMDQAPFFVRELTAETRPIIIQTGVPWVDGVFIDSATEARRFLLVLAAREQSPPDSIAELGRSIIDDLRALRVYERLASEAPAIRERTARDGLEQTARAFAAPPAPGHAGEPLVPEIRRLVSVNRERVQTFDPVLMGDSKFARALLDAAAGIDPLAEPVSPLPPGSDPERTVVVPLPRPMALAVGQVVARRPLTIEQYRQIAGNIATRVGIDELREIAGDTGLLAPFGQEALSRRLGLRWKGAENTPGSTRQDSPQPQGS